MPRRVQDIRPAEKRTIREIPVKSAPAKVSRGRKSVPQVKEREEESSALIEEIPEEIAINRIDSPVLRMPITPPMISVRPRRRRKMWLYSTLIVLVAIVGAGYFASVYYSQATFNIVPKAMPISVNGTYVAQLGDTGNDGFFYEIVTVKSTASTTVPAVSGPKVSTKATGKVTLYNASSPQTVRLIVGTRLSGDNGLVYRLTSSVVIPGYTKPAGVIVPGKLLVSVVADQPGQAYNATLGDSNDDLKIVAYKGTAKYSTIYAKAATSFAGGFVGTKKTVSPSVMASTTAMLKSRLTTELIQLVKKSVTDDSIMFDGTYTTVFGTAEIGDPSPATASVALKGTMYGIVFRKDSFIDAVSGSRVTALFDKYSFTSPGLEALQVTITNLKDFSPSKKVSLVIKAKGSLKLIGTVPVDEIKGKLSGLTLAETQEVFKSYSAVIESGSGELAPPWAKIPSDLERIKIEVEEP